MKAEETKQLICRTAAALYEEGMINDGGALSCRVGDSMIITPEKEDLSDLKTDELISLKLSDTVTAESKGAATGFPRHIALYRDRPEINALIHSRSPCVLTSSKAGRTVRPLLDDMAQIVGVSIKTAPSSMDRKSLGRLVQAIRKRNCVFIDGEGALCGSITMDDAHAICQVSEKACKSFIESHFLGGGHAINPVESWLMRLVYTKKYSKQAGSNK